MSTPARAQVATLPELLQRAARLHPERGLAIFDRRGRTHERRTLPEVLAAAQLAAGRWAALGVVPGDRILACLPTSWSLVDIWLGALLRGAAPVVLAPGAALGSSTAHLRHVEDAVALLQPRWVACGDRLAADLAAREPVAALTLPLARWASTPPTSGGEPSPAGPEDVAFLQLTSGSTGRKRAVVIPHAAVLHNIAASDDAIGAPHGRPASEWARSMVSWLPLHHDMGLVGTLLFSIACGIELSLMPPEAFLARPEAWISLLGARGPSLTAIPSFGLGLCLERAGPPGEDRDLAPWRAAMVGAEMISPDVARRFSERLSPAGFRPEVLRPCYGLAEATLSVTCDRRGVGVRTRPLPTSAPRDGLLGGAEIVSTGEPVLDTRVVIAAPDGRHLPEDAVGEVLASGPGVFAGYHGDAAATEAALPAGWLDTGDLGFLHAGELYLVGRRKEILIVHGENVMPHEIEWLAEAETGAGGACRAGAFSVNGGDAGELAIVALEAPTMDPVRNAQLARRVRERVGRELSLPLADVLVVRRGSLPKTTSGKVQRNELRRRYLERRLDVREP